MSSRFVLKRLAKDCGPAVDQVAAGGSPRQKLNQCCLRGWNFISERWEKLVWSFDFSRFPESRRKSQFAFRREPTKVGTPNQVPKSEIALPSTEAESSAISNL